MSQVAFTECCKHERMDSDHSAFCPLSFVTIFLITKYQDAEIASLMDSPETLKLYDIAVK